MSDIVERLRRYGSTDRPETPNTDTYSLLYDAADEIERLREQSDEDVRHCEQQLAEKDAEIARLRAALEEIALVAANERLHPDLRRHDVETIASRALNGEVEDTKGTKAPNRAESTVSVPFDGEVERLESRVDDYHYDLHDALFSATERDAAATRCATCGAQYQVVRPGKIQPTCDCDIVSGNWKPYDAPPPD